MEIRALKPNEVSLHRELRLRALRDSPNAFGDTIAEAESQPQAYWEELTKSVTTFGPHVMFVACEGEDPQGSTYGLLDREQIGVGRVGGMWVAPSRRRQGFGRALLEAVFTWARKRKLKCLVLWAPAHSPGAVALYRKAGFHETGNCRPLPTNSKLQIIEMVCEL